MADIFNGSAREAMRSARVEKATLRPAFNTSTASAVARWLLPMAD